jgi:hypothetical protein
MTLLVLDPYRLLDSTNVKPLVPHLFSNPNVHLIVNGPLPPRTDEAELISVINRQLSEGRGESENQPLPPFQISFVRADNALHALDALASGLEHTTSNQTLAFDIFQTDFLSSHIGPLQSLLLATTSQNPSPQLSTARRIVISALSYISETINGDRQATRQATHIVSELRQHALQASRKARHGSVVNRGIDSGIVEGGVEQEMEETKRELTIGFKGRWSWLSLLGKLRVDDVAEEVGAYIQRSFGRHLERQVKSYPLHCTCPD